MPEIIIAHYFNFFKVAKSDQEVYVALIFLQKITSILRRVYIRAYGVLIFLQKIVSILRRVHIRE